MKILLQQLNNRFVRLHKDSCGLVNTIDERSLFEKPGTGLGYSFGEYILRSAGRVEQTFGGLTSGLWDDPFEWTLEEALSTKEKILGYLDEVSDVQTRGFLFFASDEDLNKRIVTPGGTVLIFELLFDTYLSASILQDRARQLQSPSIDSRTKI